MKKQEVAKEYFQNSFNCAQSVLVAFGPDFGLTEDQCLKVACAFGAGMGRQQYTCGAVTGALMALGIKYGKALNEDDSKKQLTYAKSVSFMKEFHHRHNSINCKELLNDLDMNNESDFAKIKELGLFDTKCLKCVSDAVAITEELMNEN